MMKFGYFPGDVPSLCINKFNRSSYTYTKIACESVMKAINNFIYVEYLFLKDAEMVPFEEFGEFSSTGNITSNVSGLQALQFGKIDGFLLMEYFITGERFQHLAFTTPITETQFCIIMNSGALYQSAEASDNKFWLQPFTTHVWLLFSVALLFCTFLTDDRKNANIKQQLRIIL